MSTVINGRELADQMQAEIQKDVEKMTQQGIQPGLVVLLVGENPASQTYVRNKERAAAKIGILSKVEKLPETISEEELLAEIDKYNQDSRFHGILVQLPLPKHIDEEKILLAIDPKKDVDGFHPMNLGRLFVGKPEMIPCTPYGIMKMFEAYDIDLTGKRAVVIAKEADILVVAIGRGHFVTKEFVKPGAVVIDVGMNRNQEGKLIGDVAFDEVSEIASYITPVPKGVGPMTITMLMYQTVEAAKKQK